MLVLGAMLAGCRTTEMQLSLVVPATVDLSRVSLDRIGEGVTVEGEDAASFVLLLPLNVLNMEDAIQDAIGGRDDVVLVDVVIERVFWWTVLYGEARLELRGVMVPLPGAPGVEGTP